ncbi:hypothetical protein [Aquicoccus sp.]|uniref:hypothetical protein n=1 Tax=Aquicoccus sp. TaxID=2055851 RepID=UPI0035687586
MPEPLRSLMQRSPARHFTGFAQAVLYRGVGFSLVWKDLLEVICMGAVCLGLALGRFRKTMAGAR